MHPALSTASALPHLIQAVYWHVPRRARKLDGFLRYVRNRVDRKWPANGQIDANDPWLLHSHSSLQLVGNPLIGGRNV